MDKNELIKALYESGKITFDEALVLAEKKGTLELDEPMYQAKESLLDRVTNKTISETLNGVEVEDEYGDPEIVKFDIDKIVDFMNDNDWEWAKHDGTYELQPVTREIFKKELKRQIKETVKQVIDKYEAGKPIDECTGRYETGGLRVESHIDENYYAEKGIPEKGVVTNIEFIAENFEAFASLG